ncbi:MAG: hotdog fold thioesterase [Cyclobacteriaceae bacterium]|nr:hotdog fold thioesterase [Cyclobacteriaceae bacterium]
MINTAVSLDILNQTSKNTMVEHLGIIYTGMGPDFISAKMPVDHRTHQPHGILHGGASVVLAETLGSVAANLSVDQEKYYCVGLEVNSNHVRSMKEGWVQGTAIPIHIGKTTQIWEIRINNEQQQLVNISRLTMAVLKYHKD